MSFNLASRFDEEREKINVDLAASGVAYKERYHMPVVPELVEREQPEHLRAYFRERVQYYRQQSAKFEMLPYEPQQLKKF
ncbi:DNA polymerase III subunit theta [Chimaeribacter arupi]|uniref:DNA polymerase III subunit theta n=1 Tax=Chimaeribacter arupi TaxID=2060066 RepID=UPI000C7AA9CE|nr:DNA polymerase III subunit theta [Chimaeribacter arupi]PLR29218.1 DNA polymerase III subunit theta [Chimaeribacter arupi]